MQCVNSLDQETTSLEIRKLVTLTWLSLYLYVMLYKSHDHYALYKDLYYAFFLHKFHTYIFTISYQGNRWHRLYCFCNMRIYTVVFKVSFEFKSFVEQNTSMVFAYKKCWFLLMKSHSTTFKPLIIDTCIMWK